MRSEQLPVKQTPTLSLTEGVSPQEERSRSEHNLLNIQKTHERMQTENKSQSVLSSQTCVFYFPLFVWLDVSRSHVLSLRLL